MAILAAIMPLSGCWVGSMPALHPLYTDSDLTDDSRLRGTWDLKPAGESDTEKCSLALTFDPKKVDQLVCTDDGKVTRYEAHLVQLSGYEFLDLTTPDSGDWAIPVHLFAKIVSITPDEFQILFLGSDWLEEQLKITRFPRFERFGSAGDVLLTGDTPDLQQFVLTNVVNPEAFAKDPSIFERTK